MQILQTHEKQRLESSTIGPARFLSSSELTPSNVALVSLDTGASNSEKGDVVEVEDLEGLEDCRI